MIDRIARGNGFRNLSILCTAIVIVAVLGMVSLIIRTTAAKATILSQTMGDIPRFGAQALVSNNFGVITNLGGGLYEIVGNATTWSVLQPDGKNFKASTLAALDNQARQGFATGIRDLELRVTTGGSYGQPFAGARSTWPVDATDYSKAPYNGFKNGEYVGPPTLSPMAKLPPKDLSDTGPFYRFVYALAARYNGNTPDPARPGKNLPFVRVWSVVEEPDTKSFWYGTTAEYFGGVGGDSSAGLVPVFARAVRAANPRATVIAGGLTSQGLGLYLTHQLARSRGQRYDLVVRDYGRTYFSTWNAMANLFNNKMTDDQLFRFFENDREQARSRLFVEHSLDPSFASLLDGVAFHMYDNHRMLKDVIDLYHTHLPGKPLWGTEIGFTDSPPAGTASMVSENGQAQWLFKKMVIGTSEGLVNMSYFPLYSAGLATGGYREVFTGATTWRAARKTMHMVGNLLNELNGFRAGGQVVRGGTIFYLFHSPNGQTHALAAWNDTGTDTIDVKSLFGIGDGAQAFVFDKLEAPLRGANLRALTLGADPVLVLWSAATNLDGDGDGYPGYFDCDDSNRSVSPSATEIKGNGRDDDCNPLTN